ncbi:hypothetical protein [Bacteroides reticulotermitis]|uniref:Beta-xylosidase n=2 Tax=Bacteroides reticulotermitis TaxID=1133319 RepID=W4UVG6_9BACE|nr:hypothetical protein [Bacteroides reticulotermitis]MBB4045777.1 alpha-N-arabinofuranosidase [Bacteroides reticulotermitis]GAE84921.1 beta-xylosidase [Bacteroides reticulotermitis JCM 10512]
MTKQVPYNKQDVYLKVEAKGLDVNFSFGETSEKMINIGVIQSLEVISDNKFNKFNGPGIGVYATSNGKPSKNEASYDWFEYKAQ